ncbi:hypothetical protein LX36DRAFT_41576 [Colletotrichum falcatum]|nr:hypothetical protein LX36DRAFT_41576 [Colletotrichum falcatum]
MHSRGQPKAEVAGENTSDSGGPEYDGSAGAGSNYLGDPTFVCYLFLDNNPSLLHASFPRTSYFLAPKLPRYFYPTTESVSVQLSQLFQCQFLPTPPASLFTFFFFLFFHLLRLGCGRLTSQRTGPFAPSDSFRFRQ